MKVLRVWKRDGSRNLMELDKAVANLLGTCQNERLRQAGGEALREQLLAGETVASRLAVFRIWVGSTSPVVLSESHSDAGALA